MRFLLICFFLGGCFPGVCIAQDLYSYQNSAAFAAHLEQTNQFSLAAAEYERLIYLNPTIDSLHGKLLLAYYKAGNNTLGLKRAENIYPQTLHMPPGIARIYAGMLLKEKAFHKADSFLLSSQCIREDDRYLFLGTSQALNHNWTESLKYYRQVSPAQRAIVTAYQQVSEGALTHNRKSPALAAGLSALVPGAGKVYTKDWKDGLMSFILIGTSAWQAQRSFQQSGSNSGRGWLFASVATGFYIGNIFGSHKAARVYNLRQNEYDQKKIEDIFYADF